MRVLIDYRPALRQRTGVGEYAHQLAAALVQRLSPGGEVVLFSSSWKDRLSANPIEGATTIDARVPVRVLNLAWHRMGWPPVEWLSGPVDVAHAMHPLLIPAKRAAQVVTIHDLHFLDVPEGTTAEIRRDYPKLAASHARRADAVIVNSDHTAMQVVSRLGIARERITVCYPGAPDWRPRPPIEAPGPILFVGTIEPRKNVPTLVNAYRRLLARRPDAPELILAGGAGPNASAVLHALTVPPLSGRARHVGYVTDAQRLRLYHQASMLVLPSLEEGFGITALEAMTAGVPVIVSRRGALPEVAGDAGVFIEPDDEEGVARAMERLLEDRAFAQRCAELGIERSRRFTWRASADALVGAYGRALERRAARTA